jgi:hypothetical protein
MRLLVRESADCTGQTLVVQCTVGDMYRYPSQATKEKREDDLDNGAVEELLFGWFEGWNREGRKAKNRSLNSILSFPFFYY